MAELDLDKLIRSALLADTRTQEQLATVIGCKRSFVSAVRSGKRNAGGFQLAFCRALGIDPISGEPVRIRARVIGGARKAMVSSVVPMYRGEDGPSVDIPAEFDLTVQEAEAIILARQGKGPERLRLAVRFADLPDGMVQAIEAILDHNFPKAIERISQVMQSKKR